MQYLTLTVSFSQLKQSVFNKLKCYAINSKIKKRSQIIRTYKMFKQHYELQKHVKLMKRLTENVLEKELNQFMKERCLLQFRYNRIKQKLKQDLSLLHGDVNIKIKDWKEIISKFLNKKKVHSFNEAKRVCLQDPVLKKLARAFHKWSTWVSEYNYKMKKKQKINILRIYKEKLLVSLSMWLIGRDLVIIRKERKKIVDLKKEIKQNER